jgi:dimethylhistidine N-methyltransferase
VRDEPVPHSGHLSKLLSADGPLAIQRDSALPGSAMTRPARRVSLLDQHPGRRRMLRDVLRGLARRHKRISCKYLYDRRGSRLFDEICELPEYYPTRTETAITETYVEEMVRCVGPRCMFIEYGSGSSTKTRLLLDRLPCPAAYVPVDISREHLRFSADQLRTYYPDLDVLPVCADFTHRFELPSSRRPVERRVVYFPGSTIGNFTRPRAVRLLRGIASLCGAGGGLLIGVDLIKNPAVLRAAYNDSRGVTARFNLNLLARFNRELGADFQIDQFRHRAIYNEQRGRVEIYLVSLVDQTVALAGRQIRFSRGERIHTENSHKYDLAGFEALAGEAGMHVERVWIDSARWFSVQALKVGARP